MTCARLFLALSILVACGPSRRAGDDGGNGGDAGQCQGPTGCSADLHDVLASDEHTVVIGTYTATRHGRTHSARFIDVIHPAADGRASEYWRFFDDVAAEDEFLKE